MLWFFKPPRALPDIPLVPFSTMNAHDPLDVTSLEAGQFLPGISIPLSFANGSDDAARNQPLRHAFDSFQQLQVDGLNPIARQRLFRSFADVVRSLDRLHQQRLAGGPIAYGRIALNQFHNRGTTSEPLATLWIDPDRMATAAGKGSETDMVHAGDPEAMYFTEDRLRQGKAATADDDWYALGIVIAELALGTTTVAKIWQLCRQDGKFAEKLVKNLKHARGNRGIRKVAIRLIERSQSQSLDPKSLVRQIDENQTYIKLTRLAILFGAITVIGTSLNVYLTMQSRQQSQQALDSLESQLTEAQVEMTRLEKLATDRAAELAMLAASSTQTPPSNGTAAPVVAPVVTVNQLAKDQARWKSGIAGRALADAIQSADDEYPATWRASLQQILAQKGQKQWRAFDQTLRLRVQRFVDQPWDSAAFDAILSRIDSLNEAHSRWSTWARSDKSLEQIKEQHSLMASGRVKDFLGDWLAQAIESRDFELTIINANANDATEETAHVIGFATSNDSESEKWVWTGKEGQRPKISLPVKNYIAGDTLRLWLQVDGTLWNSTVIDHTFDSPLLIWQLAKELKLEDSESGYAVYVMTDASYGPPIKLETISGETTRPAETPQPIGKKVLDPLDSLPF